MSKRTLEYRSDTAAAAECGRISCREAMSRRFIVELVRESLDLKEITGSYVSGRRAMAV